MFKNYDFSISRGPARRTYFMIWKVNFIHSFFLDFHELRSLAAGWIKNVHLTAWKPWPGWPVFRTLRYGFVPTYTAHKPLSKSSYRTWKHEKKFTTQGGFISSNFRTISLLRFNTATTSKHATIDLVSWWLYSVQSSLQTQVLTCWKTTWTTISRHTVTG